MEKYYKPSSVNLFVIPGGVLPDVDVIQRENSPSSYRIITFYNYYLDVKISEKCTYLKYNVGYDTSSHHNRLVGLNKSTVIFLRFLRFFTLTIRYLSGRFVYSRKCNVLFKYILVLFWIRAANKN